MPNTFRKVKRYKINLQKLVGFLYTKNKHAEKEIMEIFPFTIQKKNQSRKTIIKKIKDFYNEKFKY